MRGINSTHDVEARHWEDARFWSTDLWLDDADDFDWRDLPPQTFPAVDEWAALADAAHAVTCWPKFIHLVNPGKCLLTWEMRK